MRREEHVDHVRMRQVPVVVEQPLLDLDKSRVFLDQQAVIFILSLLVEDIVLLGSLIAEQEFFGILFDDKDSLLQLVEQLLVADALKLYLADQVADS